VPADVVIVADSGPLIGLALIGQLGLLRSEARRVLVPPEVWREVTAVPTAPGAAAIGACSWIEVVGPQPDAVTAFSADLDIGEAHALALAKQTDDAWLLVDDKKARRVARGAGIRIVGTIGLLAWAKRDGHLVALAPALAALRAAGIRLSDALIDETLKAVGER
jgi:uncharacterized protein